MEETLPGDGDRWFPVNNRGTLEGIMCPMPMAIDKAKLVEHVKQKGQKIDKAQVPTHLWSFFLDSHSSTTLGQSVEPP